MTKKLALIASFALLSACSTLGPDLASVAVSEGVVLLPQSTPDKQQLELNLASGTYNCDQGHRVSVQRSANDVRQIRIGWTGRQYDLERNSSQSGLPRFEDPGSGLVWIDLPWKSVLLDGRKNKPLASDCTLG